MKSAILLVLLLELWPLIGPLSVLVIGCGKAGLTTIATVQKYFRGTKIYGIDVNDRNLEAAAKLLKDTEGVVSK